ncbi:MAG: hypothetical protein ACOX0K_07590 [Oscillospiraceae bacterium]
MNKTIVLDSGHGKKRFWHCQNARELISHQWHLFGRSAELPQVANENVHRY